MYQGVRNVSLLEDLASFFSYFCLHFMICIFALLPTKYAILRVREKQHSGKIYSMKVFLNSKFKNDSWPQLMSFSCNNLFMKNKNSNQAEKALIKLSNTVYMSMGMESCLCRCLTSQFMESCLCRCLTSQFMEPCRCRCLSSQFIF